MKDVLVKTSDEGDWVEVLIDGERVMRGHSVSLFDLVQILRNNFGANVREVEFTVEEWDDGTAEAAR